MAGGTTSGGRGNLGQRTAQTGHGTQDVHGKRPAGWFPDPAVAEPPPVRHCWYDGPHGRQAALLLEWRKVGDGYDGRLAVMVPDGDGWALVEMWVEAAMLSPLP